MRDIHQHIYFQQASGYTAAGYLAYTEQFLASLADNPYRDLIITGPLKEAHLGEAALYSAGSVLGISGAQTVRKVQKNYLKHSRLGIPLLFMADVVHGYKTDRQEQAGTGSLRARPVLDNLW